MEIFQSLVHDADMIFVKRMCYIDDVQKDIGIPHLIERAFEGCHKMRR